MSKSKKSISNKGKRKSNKRLNKKRVMPNVLPENTVPRFAYIPNGKITRETVTNPDWSQYNESCDRYTVFKDSKGRVFGNEIVNLRSGLNGERADRVLESYDLEYGQPSRVVKINHTIDYLDWLSWGCHTMTDDGYKEFDKNTFVKRNTCVLQVKENTDWNTLEEVILPCGSTVDFIYFETYYNPPSSYSVTMNNVTRPDGTCIKKLIQVWTGDGRLIGEEIIGTTFPDGSYREKFTSQLGFAA